MAHVRDRGLKNEKLRGIFNSGLGGYEADVAQRDSPKRPRLAPRVAREKQSKGEGRVTGLAEEREGNRNNDSVRSETGADDASNSNPSVGRIEQPAAPAALSPVTPSDDVVEPAAPAAPSPPIPSDDVVMPCPHVEEKVQWGPLGMLVACCKHAFTAGVDCDLVYCYPRCQGAVCPPKSRGGKKSVEGVAVRRGTANKGDCGAYTKEDVSHLRIGPQDKYRRDDRLNEDGHEKIAKYCYYCGKIV